MPNGTAAKIVAEILKNRQSHSYAALAGWHYIPTGAEIAMWDGLEADGRLAHPRWRPWASRTQDILRDPQADRQKHEQAVRNIQQVYGITTDP